MIEQLTPAWNAARAKAGEFDQVKGQVSQLNSAAAKAGQRAKAEGKRADHYQDVTELFTPAEIEAARERRAALERTQAAHERDLELQAEKQRRIDALPELRQKTAGAEHTFVNHALEAIKRAEGDLTKVEWVKVEATAVLDSIAEHGQSKESVTRAICALSPERANIDGHAKVAQDIAAIAPKLQHHYEVKRGEKRGLER